MKIDRKLSVEISILCGIMGFFIGGLFAVKKEVVDILFYATITGTSVLFLSYFLINATVGAGFKTETGSRKKGKAPEKKQEGKKIDYTVGDEEGFEDIYNTGKKS